MWMVFAQLAILFVFDSIAYALEMIYREALVDGAYAVRPRVVVSFRLLNVVRELEFLDPIGELHALHVLSGNQIPAIRRPMSLPQTIALLTLMFCASISAFFCSRSFR